MRKNCRKSILVSISAAILLFACGGPGVPSAGAPEAQSMPGSASADAAWDEQALKKRCAGFVEAFRAGEFGAFYEAASDALKAELPQEQLAQEWNALAATARVYSGVQTEQALPGQGEAEVIVTSVHSRYNLRTAFTFSDNDTVSAFSVSLAPLLVEPEAGELWEEIPITVGYDAEKPLNGMLTIPKNVEKPPVAILVQGSGPSGMDSLIGAANNRPFADLAHGLAERGVATIRYDKRSYVYPADVVDVQTEYLYDVKAAVRFALEDTRVDGERLFLIGHSQGGMLSTKFALDNPEIKGIVSLGGTARRIEDKILEQTKTRLEQDTVLTQEQKDAEIARTQAELERVRALTPESADERTELLLGYPVSYWISLNEIDQQEIARKTKIPMLILQGDEDFQVTYENDFLFWQEVLAGKDNATFRHYAGLSHVFMPGSRERFDSSSYDPPAHMDAQVIADIAVWILK